MPDLTKTETPTVQQYADLVADAIGRHCQTERLHYYPLSELSDLARPIIMHAVLAERQRCQQVALDYAERWGQATPAYTARELADRIGEVAE